MRNYMMHLSKIIDLKTKAWIRLQNNGNTNLEKEDNSKNLKKGAGYSGFIAMIIRIRYWFTLRMTRLKKRK